MKKFQGSRVVGYYEAAPTRHVVIAVRRAYDYYLFIGYMNPDKNVDDNLPMVADDSFTTRTELDRQLSNLINLLS